MSYLVVYKDWVDENNNPDFEKISNLRNPYIPHIDIGFYQLHLARFLAHSLYGEEVNKFGDKLTDHAERVASSFSDKDYVTKSVAYLHDVLEDCPGVTTKELTAYGLLDVIVDKVEIITRRSGEPYKEYINRLIESRDLAVLEVKSSDLTDHLQKSSMYKIPNSLLARYANALIDIDDAIDNLLE